MQVDFIPLVFQAVHRQQDTLIKTHELLRAGRYAHRLRLILPEQGIILREERQQQRHLHQRLRRNLLLRHILMRSPSIGFPRRTHLQRIPPRMLLRHTFPLRFRQLLPRILRLRHADLLQRQLHHRAHRQGGIVRILAVILQQPLRLDGIMAGYRINRLPLLHPMVIILVILTHKLLLHERHFQHLVQAQLVVLLVIQPFQLIHGNAVRPADGIKRLPRLHRMQIKTRSPNHHDIRRFMHLHPLRRSLPTHSRKKKQAHQSEHGLHITYINCIYSLCRANLGIK